MVASIAGTPMRSQSRRDGRTAAVSVAAAARVITLYMPDERGLRQAVSCGSCPYNHGMQFDQITIIGVGLIGGSVGLAAKSRGVARRVVGVDRNAEALKKAEALGAIDAGTTDLPAGVRESQLVVACTPVDRISEVLIKAFEHAGPVLYTDAGSVKGGLADAVEWARPDGATYVPAHPLAGAEKNSVEYARADLFENRVTIVTPWYADPDPDEAAIEQFWQALGSRIVRMNAEEHDRVLAFTSHLPHAVASAVAGITSPDLLALSAGGFRDVTRIAAGDPKLWAAIFQANKDGVLSALTAFTNRLVEFRKLLEAGDRAGLEQWLTEGKQVRDALGT
jgi:prephenate dehydrogenase